MGRMLRNLLWLGISVSVALGLLQAFLFTKAAHAEPAANAMTKIALPVPALDSSFSLEKALATRRSIRNFTGASLTMTQIGQLCWAAQGITQASTGKRTAPSARAAYPLELYLVAPQGTWHYVPAGHLLEVVSSTDQRAALSAACGGQPQVKAAGVNVIITADLARAQTKLGANCRPWVEIEAGHVAQNLLLQSVALGLGAVPVGALREVETREALKIPENLSVLYNIVIGVPAGR